jgi:hypothetical protein
MASWSVPQDCVLPCGGDVSPSHRGAAHRLYLRRKGARLIDSTPWCKPLQSISFRCNRGRNRRNTDRIRAIKLVAPPPIRRNESHAIRRRSNVHPVSNGFARRLLCAGQVTRHDRLAWVLYDSPPRRSEAADLDDIANRWRSGQRDFDFGTVVVCQVAAIFDRLHRRTRHVDPGNSGAWRATQHPPISTTQLVGVWCSAGTTNSSIVMALDALRSPLRAVAMDSLAQFSNSPDPA